MHELEQKLRPIAEMKEKLTEWCKCELDKGKEQVDTKEMGEVIDMIKDLAEAEEKCVKGAYYKTVVRAMAEEEQMSGRMGYDNWRTDSGRFANKGTGNYRPAQSGRRGYDGMYPVDPDMMAEGDWRPEWGPYMDGMMGYNGGGRGGSSGGSQGGPGSGRGGNSGGSSGSSSGGSQGGNSGGGSSGYNGGRMGYHDPEMERIMQDERHGRPYKEWKMSRRHYTETKSEGDKQEMSEHAKEHMADTVLTIKEIWMGADPELRAKMKQDLTALMNEMK